MTEQTKAHIQEVVLVVTLVGSFALGRFSVRPAEIKEVTHVETEKQKDIDKDKKTVIVQHPDGTTVTTIDESTRTQIKQNAQTQTDRSSSKAAIYSAAVLGGFDSRTHAPVYGLSVSKEVLGPVTAGVWGLNNGTIGVSVGFNF